MTTPAATQADSPFAVPTHKPLVAIQGLRGGYLQVATARQITQYAALPDTLMLAAKDWAARLESLGARRVYWLTLSEVVPHLHIHLYPRWQDDELRGLPLFEARTNWPQPPWSEALASSLADWAGVWQVELVELA